MVVDALKKAREKVEFFAQGFMDTTIYLYKLRKRREAKLTAERVGASCHIS